MKQYGVKNGGVQNEPTRRKTKHRNFGKNLSAYFSDYSSNTSIQGVKYLGERNRSIFEKLFWLIFLSTSICLCAYLISRVYNKWQSAPVIVTFSNNLIPVWKVPFPAVTICPEAKTRKSVYDYTKTFNKLHNDTDNITKEELKHFEQMNFLCGDESLPNGSNVIGDDTIDFIYEVAPTCDEWWCHWNHSNEDGQSCDKLLTPVLTDDGVCFSFNMLDREELFTSSAYYYRNFLKHGIKSTNWSLEKGYSKDVGIDDYPRRTSAGFALTFAASLLGYEPDLDYGCRASVQGYKIFLHNPAEMPRMNGNFFMASFDKQILVSMKPDMMTTSDELESYTPEKRQCYYSYEKQLKYFKVYTQNNCDLECLTNRTLATCGCVSYYMPRNTTTSICGRAKAICIAAAENIMISQEMKLENENESQGRCNCLPSCSSLTYNIETSEVDHKWKKSLEARNSQENMSDNTLTQIFFSFNVQYFITTERKELYGVTDFIANCGGFLGLFLGLSFLSIVEIIYFLTLRLICNVQTYGWQFWSGSSRFHSDSRISMPIESCSTVFKQKLRKQPLAVVDVK